MCSRSGDNLTCSPSVVRSVEVNGGWQDTASVCFWEFEYKWIDAVFELWPDRGCEDVFKAQLGYFFSWVLGFVLGLFCPVELGSPELTGAQAFFVSLFVFLALRSMFWCFFVCFFKGDAFRKDLYHYLCLCVLDGSHFPSPLCLSSGLVLHTLRWGRVVNT